MQSTSSTRPLARRWLILALSLIALSTVLFVTGVVIERGIAAAPTSTHQGAQPGETTSADPDGGHNETPSKSPPQGSGRTETVFGLDLENPFVVGAFVVVWLGLAVALLRLGRLAWVALLFVAIGAAVLDVTEVGRQWAEAHLTVALFAVLVALAHMALVVLAGFILVRSRREKRLSFN
ncbi:MAG TPA: hypothetical protein VKR06_05215 [Ktedonosporobacter sp.]|nr:hypothetical protein [Ktedonosporobacter sp.]